MCECVCPCVCFSAALTNPRDFPLSFYVCSCGIMWTQHQTDNGERDRGTEGQRDWQTGVSGACPSLRWMDTLTDAESEAREAVIGCCPKGGDVVFSGHFGPKLGWSPECHLNTLDKGRILVFHYFRFHHLRVNIFTMSWTAVPDDNIPAMTTEPVVLLCDVKLCSRPQFC